MKEAIRSTLYSFYYTLYYYQTIIEQLGIYYCRTSKKNTKIQQENNKKIAKPFYVKFMTVNFTLFAVKCFIIAFIRSATSSRVARIRLGSEHWGQSGTAAITETTFLFWTLIVLLFLTVTLSSDNPIDYSFLALFRMEEKGKSKQKTFLQPKSVDLSHPDYVKFNKLRHTVIWYYHSIICSLVPVTFVAFIVSNSATGVFRDSPFFGIFWVAVNTAWAFLATSVIYTNLLAFILTAGYIKIKQNSIIMKLDHKVKQSITKPRSNKNHQTTLGFSPKINLLVSTKMLFLHRKYCHLYKELAEYNSFWRSYLSVIFTFYTTIVALGVYICFLAPFPVFNLNAAYYIVVLNHLINMYGIIYVAGGVVYANGRLSKRWTALTGELSTPKGHFEQQIKMNSICEHLNANSKSGFCLLNDYLITYKTAELIIGNVATYFFLTVAHIKRN